MGGWSPLSDPGWLRNPDWVLDEERPERPVSVPAGNNRPELVPYRYRGSDCGLPGPPPETFSDIRPARNHGAPLHDPEWHTAPPWMCRPPYWDAEEAS